MSITLHVSLLSGKIVALDTGLHVSLLSGKIVALDTGLDIDVETFKRLPPQATSTARAVGGQGAGVLMLVDPC